MAKKKPVTGSGEGSEPPSLGQVYPTIARWASGYGWVMFGINAVDHPFVRALDEGGMVWEGKEKYKTLGEALQAYGDGAQGVHEGGGIRKATGVWKPTQALS